MSERRAIVPTVNVPSITPGGTTATAPPTKGSPAHKAMMQRRIADVVRWRLRGASFRDVCGFVRELEKLPGSAWFVDSGCKPLSTKSLERYQRKADKEMFVTKGKSRARIIYRHLKHRRELYKAARDAGDLRTALSILQDEAKLRGLYPPKKVAPTSPDGKSEYDGRLAHLGPLVVALRAALERREAEAGAREVVGAGNPAPADGRGPAE